jgi:hypothetical protein
VTMMMGRARTGSRRSVGYLAAAIALIGVVAGFILVFGVMRPPRLQTIAEGGVAPPGGVALLQRDDRGTCLSLHVVRPDGTVATSGCDASLNGVVGWTTEGVVVTAWLGSGEVVRIYDPRSLAMVSSRATSENTTAGTGQTIGTETSSAGVMTVYWGADYHVLWRVDAPANYRVESGARSPDGRWFAMTDTAGRLLLVPSDGTASPLVWATGLGASTWPGPVWEGTPVEAAVG